jgi:hypothetical protein
VLELVLGFWAECVAYIGRAEAAMAEQLRPAETFCCATTVLEACLLLQPLLAPLTAHLARGTPAAPEEPPDNYPADPSKACLLANNVLMKMLVGQTDQRDLRDGGQALAKPRALSALCRSALRACMCLQQAQQQGQPAAAPRRVVGSVQIAFWSALTLGIRAWLAVWEAPRADHGTVARWVKLNLCCFYQPPTCHGNRAVAFPEWVLLVSVVSLS